MILTSSLKRIAMAAAAAAATAWVGTATPAMAQYYGGPGYGRPTYVPPKVLRKQREMQMRVLRKYGRPPPAYGYRAPVYRQPAPYGYGYGYGAPVYRQPAPYGYGYNAPVYRQPQVYRQAPQPNYGYTAPVYRQPRGYGYGNVPSPVPQPNADGLTLQDRIGSAR